MLSRPPVLQQRSSVASLVVDPDHGGRLVSLVVDGRELLVAPDPNPMHSGCYPMVPFAGRIRDGRFRWAGREVELPANLGPHAIHGYGFTSPWEVLGPDHLRAAFGPPWPFGGWAEQRIALFDDRLELELSVHADPALGPMPATAGWHPWFVRPVELSFEAGAMLCRDATGMPSGELARPVPPGPWDDCFTELGAPPVLRWPGGPTVTLDHDAPFLVVYDEPAHALCVEPQTGPPDAFSSDPDAHVATPGRPVIAHATLRWG